MGNNFAFPPGSDENLGHMKYFRTWIDHFAELGAPVVRVFAARGLPKGVSDEKIIESVIANLNEALAYAEKRGDAGAGKSRLRQEHRLPAAHSESH